MHIGKYRYIYICTDSTSIKNSLIDAVNTEMVKVISNKKELKEKFYVVWKQRGLCLLKCCCTTFVFRPPLPGFNKTVNSSLDTQLFQEIALVFV